MWCDFAVHVVSLQKYGLRLTIWVIIMPRTHRYVSRFGSGLVIYWQGCTERVFRSSDDGSGVVAATSFPTDWYFPTGERAVVGQVPQFDSFLPMLDVEQRTLNEASGAARSSQLQPRSQLHPERAEAFDQDVS